MWLPLKLPLHLRPRPQNYALNNGFISVLVSLIIILLGMKHLICLFATLLLLFTACEKETAETIVTCEEGYYLDDRVPLPIGIELRIIEVNDNYCSCSVQCVWGGYLDVIVRVEGANRRPHTLGWTDRLAT